MEFCLLLTAADIAASVSASGIDGSSFLPLPVADDGLTVVGAGDMVLGLTTSWVIEGSSIELEVATLAV